MPWASVNGIRLYYEVTGSGAPLVLAHGYACGVRSWDPQVHALARSRRVITYDVRDHGITEAPEDPSAYSQDISVEDLHGLLTHLKIRRAAIGKTHPFMADCIKGSTHLVLRNAGHLTNLEAPAAFNAAVKRFLGR